MSAAASRGRGVTKRDAAGQTVDSALAAAPIRLRVVVEQVTNLMYFMSSEAVRQTNPKCTFKTEIANDRAEPTILVSLDSNRSVLFKAGNLTTLEVLQLWNRHITPLAAAPEDAAQSTRTKAGKARLR